MQRGKLCLNTTQLECFIAVANFLNFSRAAEHLRITQPAVSHQINALENELGTRLFHRTSKSVQLTQAGHLFLQYAGEILKLTGLSKARIQESQATLPQRFGIGCHNYTELYYLGAVLEAFRQELPQVIPILRMIPFASLDRLLEEDDIQVLLTLREIAPVKAAYHELTRCSIVCVCGEGHPLAAASQLTLPQLAEGGKIIVCPPPVYPPSLLSVQHQAVAGRGPDQMLFCDNLDVASALIRSGYAFAIMADLPGGRLPGLRYIPLPEFGALSYGAAYLSGKKSPALKCFLATAQSLILEQPA